MAARTWNAELDNQLITLWNDGRSSQAIANVMHISRSAVVGKVFRLRKRGIVLRTDAAPGPRAQAAGRVGKVALSKARSQRRFNRPRNGRQQTIFSIIQRYSEPVTSDGAHLIKHDDAAPKIASVVDLQPHHCKYPIGEPTKAGFGFCGEERAPGLPYCLRHVARAYRVAPEVSESAADYLAGKNARGPLPPSESEPRKELELIPS